MHKINISNTATPENKQTNTCKLSYKLTAVASFIMKPGRHNHKIHVKEWDTLQCYTSGPSLSHIHVEFFLKQSKLSCTNVVFLWYSLQYFVH